MLRVMCEDGARGKDWLRARGHHLCLTDTIFFSFFFFFFLGGGGAFFLCLREGRNA